MLIEIPATVVMYMYIPVQLSSYMYKIVKSLNHVKTMYTDKHKEN